MNKMTQHIKSEALKIMYNKNLRIVLVLIFILQPVIAYISAKQQLATGLDATPETVKFLVEAIPPIEYIGFDVTPLGMLIMVIFGALLGGQEYKNQTIRTSLLANPNKSSFLIVKMLVTTVFILIISFLSIYLSIMVTHYALGSEGLNPVLLNGTAWLFVLLSMIAWTGLILLSFGLSFLFKSSVVALLFLIPQIYGLGDFLASRIALAKLLPVSLAQGLVADSPNAMSTNYGMSIALLGIWVVVVGVLAFVRFTKQDVRGS